MCPLGFIPTAPGLHPVPGGVFPVPPAAVVLMKLLPPPTCFTVSCTALILSSSYLPVRTKRQLRAAFICSRTHRICCFVFLAAGTLCSSGRAHGNFQEIYTSWEYVSFLPAVWIPKFLYICEFSACWIRNNVASQVCIRPLKRLGNCMVLHGSIAFSLSIRLSTSDQLYSSINSWGV